MEKISRFSGLVGRGLFLRTEAYEELREARNPFIEGLFIILIVGVLVALAGIIGSTLEWSASPGIDSIQQAIYDEITSMSWFREVGQDIGPQFARGFQTQWDWIWSLARRLIPTPVTSLSGIITIPLRLILSWLFYGLLAHLFARLLGGGASLSQTLGTTALAVTPQVLNLAGLLPFVMVGGVVGTWSLLCQYVALRQAHGLTWGRTFWATVLPRVVIWLLVMVLVSLSVALFAALAPQWAPFLGGS